MNERENRRVSKAINKKIYNYVNVLKKGVIEMKNNPKVKRSKSKQMC